MVGFRAAGLVIRDIVLGNVLTDKRLSGWMDGGHVHTAMGNGNFGLRRQDQFYTVSAIRTLTPVSHVMLVAFGIHPLVRVVMSVPLERPIKVEPAMHAQEGRFRIKQRKQAVKSVRQEHHHQRKDHTLVDLSALLVAIPRMVLVLSVISVLMELTKTKLNRQVVWFVLRELTLCILVLPSVESPRKLLNLSQEVPLQSMPEARWCLNVSPKGNQRHLSIGNTQVTEKAPKHRNR